MSNSKALALIAALTLPAIAPAADPEPSAPELAQVTISPAAYALSPDAELVYRLLVAEVAGKRGQLAVALENYREATRLSDDPRIAERTVGIALFMEDYPVALEAAERWYLLDDSSLPARQALVVALLRNGRIDAAVEHLDAVLQQTDPATVTATATDDTAQGFAQIAVLLRQLKDPDLMLQAMQALREQRQTAQAHYQYALTALALEDYDQALVGLEAALALNPTWSQAQLLKAQLLVQQDKTDEALASMATAVAAQPEDHTLRMGYARMLIGAERLNEATAELQKIAATLKEGDPAQTPTTQTLAAEALYYLGLLASEDREFDAAEGYFMRVLTLGERVMDTYYELGRVEEERENFEKAREWYARVDDTGRYLNAQIRVAGTLARQEDFSGMSSHLATLRQDYPDNAVGLYLAEAEFLRDAKRPQPAFDVLTQALAEYVNNPDLLYSRALIAEKLDRLDILERDLRLILDSNPDNGHALNALGYTLADRTDRHQEALEYLQRAIALLPDDPAVLDSMGWIKYRLGEPEKSLEYLRRAYELNQDPEIASHLSEVLWAAEQHEEAKAVWQKSFEDNPDSEHLLKLREKLGL